MNRFRRQVPLLAAFAVVCPGTALAQAAPGPVFEDGQAQVVEAFADPADWIREELWVETEFDSDGDGAPDRVHVAVVRPGQTADGLRVPVVYESSPYFAGTSGTLENFWDVRHELGESPPPRLLQEHPTLRAQPGISSSHVSDWVPRGFAVVHSEAPGTGLSLGCPTVGGAPEALAPKAVIDWLNGRARGFTTVDGSEEVRADWSTGKVGMTGTSYNGTIPLAAATTGVEGLEAIIPVAPNTSYYRYYRSHGLVRSPGGYLGEDVDVLFDFIHSGNRARRAYCDEVVRDEGIVARQDRLTGDFNDFWAGRDFMRLVDRVEAATFMAHAFNDWNVMPEHSVRVYEALRERGVPAQAYFHQGGHGGPPPFELMNRWFTRYLYGVENGAEDEPHAWIVREGDDRLHPTPYPDYPHPEAEGATVFPAGGGSGRGALALQPGEGVEDLVDDVSLTGAEHARARSSEHRLLYATPPLAEDVHVSGTPTVSIRLAADRRAANLSVWLVELPWEEEGQGGVITRGWADPQNHAQLGADRPGVAGGALDRALDHVHLDGGEPLEPGRFYELTFDLQPDDQIIPAGSRVGLVIFSSDPEFTLWPAPGTTLSVDLAGTSLVLPVVGGREALARAMGRPATD